MHTIIVAACIPTLMPFAERFFPGLLDKGSSGGADHLTRQGKGTKLKGSPYNTQAFALQSYRGGEGGQHIVTVSTKVGRDLRRCNGDGDAESQERMVGIDRDIDAKEGVFITRTVHVS